MFQAPADKGNLYIYRDENYGAAIRMSILLNNQLLSDTVAKSYIYQQLEPGTYTITSKAENNSSMAITIEAGKNHFLWQEVKMGMWTARSDLQVVDEATGRKGVQSCKILNSNAYQ